MEPKNETYPDMVSVYRHLESFTKP